jgi:Ser/Thr protein kinase RdoA (MazF antagonist)
VTAPGSWVGSRPAADLQSVAADLERWWGLAGELSHLPSERDRNILVRPPDGAPVVLKIANLAEDPSFLECQDIAMARLAAAGVPVARSVPARDGRTLVDLGGPGAPWARVLTWLPGRPFAVVLEPSDALLADVGATMGRCGAALADLDHPAAIRDLQWDVVRAPDVIRARLGDVTDEDHRALLERTLSALETRLVPALPSLRRSVIHNDANDHNLLVDDAETRIVGLLDFGDLVMTVTAHEAAVAATYAMFHRADPVSVIGPLVGAFDDAFPLTGPESDALPDLVLARVATSVAISAHQAALDPDPYLRVSETAGWTLLAELDRVGIGDLRAAVHEAVGR